MKLNRRQRAGHSQPFDGVLLLGLKLCPYEFIEDPQKLAVALGLVQTRDDKFHSHFTRLIPLTSST
jgi:hypothetical protein